MRTFTLNALLVTLGLTLVGCSQGDAQVSPLREKLLLSEEPTGAVSITESCAALMPEDSSEPVEPSAEKDVVVVGRIGAGEYEPWAEGQASFLMSEALPETDHAATPGHDPATCPFCRRRAQKAEAVTALVQFRDEAGDILPIDARKLLGVEANQIVVVRGKGHVDKLGVLVVSATGIHVRR